MNPNLQPTDLFNDFVKLVPLQQNDFDALYYVDINSQLSTSGVWIQDHIISSIKDTIDNQFKSEKTIFTLFQSNMHIDRNIYLPIINENINAI